MNKEIKIEVIDDFTVYIVNNVERFRIVQNNENEFIIQKEYITTKVIKFLWRKKIITHTDWKRVDKDGVKYYSIGTYVRRTNNDNFKIYKTFDKAVKWIEDYNKYPIYH